jgi:hypothetical protein
LDFDFVGDLGDLAQLVIIAFGEERNGSEVL